MMDRKIIFFGIVFLSVVIFMASGAPEKLGGLMMEGEETRLAVTDVLQGNVYLWGIDHEDMEAPVELQRGQNNTKSFIEGNVSIAEVYGSNLPKIAEEVPDFRILPYQINTPVTNGGIYVDEGSRITSVEGLDGKQVAYPSWIKTPPNLEEDLLVNMYGIEVEWVEKNGSVNNWPNRTKEVVKEDDVDAVFMVGARRAGNHSLKPLFSPYKELEDEFGDSALNTFFVVRNDRRSIEAGFEAMAVLQESARLAQNSREEFMEAHVICNEFLVTDGRIQIQVMSPGFEEGAQYLHDIGYEQGRFDRRVNISDRIVRQTYLNSTASLT